VTHAIIADRLSKTYRTGVLRRREVHALTDFSVTVDGGQIFGLLGPNGAGKTTFIKILLSLTAPGTGTGSLLGAPLGNVAIRGRVGYLPENHRFPLHLTGEQVIHLAGRLTGVAGATLTQRTTSLLDLVGMAQWRAVKIKKYSKGMVQRLGLAQALINDPDLLFLDEPTDGVDPVGRKEIRDVLRNLRAQGKTIFLNSHLLSEVELVSDQVAILNKGHLIKLGTVDELTTTEDHFRIGYEGALPPTLHTELAAFVIKTRIEPDAIVVEAPSTGDLNHFIDLLRKHDIPITSIAKQRSTLEESFISLIKREGNA
jgi:ABC-2 type transport system ATP-binding protein